LDSNEIDENDAQHKKHRDARISILFGITMDSIDDS
jgi:hypothetical protein